MSMSMVMCVAEITIMPMLMPIILDMDMRMLRGVARKNHVLMIYYIGHGKANARCSMAT
jgi:hypothetical protein